MEALDEVRIQIKAEQDVKRKEAEADYNKKMRQVWHFLS
jgi:hypothetical protein